MHPAIRSLSCALVAVSLFAGRGAAQAADASSVDSAILEILKARGIIGPEEYEELAAMVRAQAGQHAGELDVIENSLSRLRAPDVQTTGGTSGKLVFKSTDGAWTMGIKGQIQARIESLHSEDSTKSVTSVSVPRARLAFEGTAGAPNVKYRLQIDASTNSKPVDPATENAVTTRDVYVDVGFLGPNSVRMGQFKFPMGREQLTSHEIIDLQELSIATTEFTPSYEPAAMVSGKLAEGVFEYQVAMSNGEGRGKNNTPGEDRNGLRSGARVVWNPLGAITLEGPAFQTAQTGDVRLGIGAAWMKNKDSQALNTVTPSADAETTDFEAGLYAGPVALMAEAFERVNDPATGSDVVDTGRNYQIGWLVDSAVWELVARYSTIDFGAKDDQDERTLGLNYYIEKHNAKLMLDYSLLGGDGAVPDAERIRLMFQALF
jgi:phosphate-selective porin